jgi:O-antigen/teichoic acid export membrane protein
MPLEHSIIRRSAGVTIAFLIGHAFNYALYWSADHILDPARFGLFYTAVVSIGIAMSPMIAVTLVLARHFATIAVREGREGVAAATGRVLAFCVRAWPAALVFSALLAMAAPFIGIDSWQVAFFIPLAVLASVVVEIERSAFQGMLLFARGSVLWIANTGAQFVFSLSALYLFSAVWTGIAGILIGAGGVGAVFAPRFLRSKQQRKPAQPILPLLKRDAPFIISYSLFVLFNNLDILAAYLLLPRVELGIYTASALLPKAIVTATFAVAQVVLPVLTARRTDGLPLRRTLLKGVGLTLGIAAGAVVLLSAGIPWLQSTPLAIRGLDLELMRILALGAVVFCALRVLVVIEVALQQYAIGIAQAGAILAFALLCTESAANPMRIAELYVLVGVAFVLLTGAAAIAFNWYQSTFKIVP